jgi:hypothetical protein
MGETEKIIIIADQKFFDYNIKIKTISLNNSKYNTDIYAYYENNTFRINNYKIIENKSKITLDFLSSSNEIDYIKNDNIITLKFFYLNPYLKLAYILYILGYRNIAVYGLNIIESSQFYENKINKKSISIYSLFDIYTSLFFSEFIKNKNINIVLIEDDLTLSSKLNRITINNFINNIIEYIFPNITLCDFLFINNDENINFLKKYTKLVIKNNFSAQVLLSYNYLIINKDLIDINLINEYNKTLLSNIFEISNENMFEIFKNNFVGLPLNYKDYEIVKNYYNFNVGIYKIYLNDTKFNNFNDFDLFNHFLMYENEKFIFNFPEEFNYNDYLELNPDLLSLKTPKLILTHFLTNGIKENRNVYKELQNFNWSLYCTLNDLKFDNKYSAEYHYIKYGKQLNLLTSDFLPQNFDVNNYIKCNPDLKLLHEIDAIKHFIKYGSEKFNYIRLPLDFNYKDYLKLNPDIKLNLNDEKLVIKHFINNGIYENRLIKINKINYKKQILCICHNGNIHIFKKLEKYIQNLMELNSFDIEITLFINTINTIGLNEIEYIKNKFPSAKHIIIQNFGFDIGSFFMILKICKENNYEFDYVVKIHTKTSDTDRDNLLKPILGSVNRIKLILNILENEKIGLVGSKRSMFYNYDKLSVHNQNHLKYLLEKFKVSINYYECLQFIGGTMFWTKYEILKKIFWSYNFDDIIHELNTENSFDWNWYVCANNKFTNNIKTKEEAYKHYNNYGNINGLSPNIFHAIKFNTKSEKLRDGMIEHAYERFFSYAIENLGYIQYFIQEESFLETLNIKPLPIVFPQFHSIPENNKFWCENFTEWTLLNKVTHDYTGKKLIKPHKSLNYYNILDDNYINKTESILKEYNIPFLCYYHYWFKGHKVMYKPIEYIRDNSKPNINYCLFWANETWSSRWDGLEDNILLKQEYGNKENWNEHINYLLTFFKDPKYIKIDSKPLFFIYRPLEIPIDIFDSMILLFNKTVKSNGFSGLHLIISYNNVNNLDKYNDYIHNKLVSGVLDFNPNYTNAKKFKYYQETDDEIIFEKDSNNNIIFNEAIYLNYNPDVKIAIEKKQIQSAKLHYENLSDHEKKTRIYKSNLANIISCYEFIENEPKKHICQLTSTFMDWNNTPRRDITKSGVKPTIFINASPNLFKVHLKKLIFKAIKEPNEDINYILINAWNEWNEQTCLEPSDIYEYKYIEAVKEVFSEYY